MENSTLNTKQKYILLLNNLEKKNQNSINLLNINQKGLYKLYPTKDSSIMKKSGFIGHIKFSEILYRENIALMVVSIQDNLKSGIEKLILFEETDNKWLIKKEIVLSIW